MSTRKPLIDAADAENSAAESSAKPIYVSKQPAKTQTTTTKTMDQALATPYQQCR